MPVASTMIAGTFGPYSAFSARDHENGSIRLGAWHCLMAQRLAAQTP
jgi:hypothetical protein